MRHRTLTAAGFPAAGTIFDVSSFRLEVRDGPHPWLTGNEAGIGSLSTFRPADGPHKLR